VCLGLVENVVKRKACHNGLETPNEFNLKKLQNMLICPIFTFTALVSLSSDHSMSGE